MKNGLRLENGSCRSEESTDDFQQFQDKYHYDYEGTGAEILGE